MREREPTSTTEDLEIEVDGKTHRGQRVVLTVSDTEIRQEIRHKSLRRVDPDVYALAHADFMRAIAREILWRLVAQWRREGNACQRSWSRGRGAQHPRHGDTLSSGRHSR